MENNLYPFALSLSLCLNLLLLFCSHKKLYSFLHTLTYFILNTLLSLFPQNRRKTLFLTHQILILKRVNKKKTLIPNPYERFSLLILSRKLKNTVKYQHIFTPKTLVNWHKKMIRMHWTYPYTSRRGRPQTPKEIKTLIRKLASDYTGRGYNKIQGELKKLGYTASKTTIKNILRQYQIPAAAERKDSSGWLNFIKHHKDAFLASDFLAVTLPSSKDSMQSSLCPLKTE